MHRMILVAGLLMVLGVMASAQTSQNVSLRGQIPYPVGTSAEVWGSGDLAIVSRRASGFSIIDVSDPNAPQEVFSGNSQLFVRDAKTHGNLLACTNESGNGQGVYLYDISNPAMPQLLGSYGSFAMPTCYNLTFSPNGDYLYCCSFITNRVVVLDISNPASPMEVNIIASQAVVSQTHDAAVVNGKLYLSWLSGGFEVHDITDPANPSLEVWHQVPTSFVHNCWPLPGGTHVATTDELAGGYLRIWDIQNPASVVETGQWRTSMVAVMHNVLIQDNYAYVTNYTEGLRIVDVQDPTAPVEVGHYDTFPGVNPFSFGAWGVFPLDATRLYVADFNSGFYSLDFTPVSMSVTAQATTYNWGETVLLDLVADNLTAQDQPILGELTFSVQQLGAQAFPLLALPLVMPPNFQASLTYPIPLPPGAGTFDVEFQLKASTLSGATVLDVSTASITIQ